MHTASWLEGVWSVRAGNGDTFESWRKIDDSTFAGESYVVRNEDTVVLETISLEERLGQIRYVPTVSGQNEGLPVVFTNTKFTPEELVFENREHDFPQKIHYRKVDIDSMVAEISGFFEGDSASRQFPMRKL